MALAVLQKSKQSDQQFAAKIWSWRGFLFRMQERYGEALEAYQSSIHILEKSGYSRDLSFALNNAATIFTRRNDYKSANAYLKNALLGDTAYSFTKSICVNLAENYFWEDSLQQALYWYKVGLTKPTGSPRTEANLQSLGGALMLKNNELHEARRLTLAALPFFLSDPKETDNRLRSLTTLADIAARQHQPRQAEAYYRQAEAEGKKSYTFKSREMAKLYIEWGRFLEKQRQPERALACYQQALIQAFPKFNSLNVSDNPSLEEAWLESQAMEAALAKAMVLAPLDPPPSAPLKLFESQAMDAVQAKGNVLMGRQQREASAHCFDLAFAVAARMRRTYGNDADKLALAANLRPALNAAVLNLQKIYAANQSPATLLRLFELLEQTRATALSDALRQQRGLALAGIPDSLLAREESLRREDAALSSDLKKSELSRDTAAVARLQPVAFRASMAYSDLMSRLQNQHPQFRQYTQADQAAQVTEIAKSLPDTTALLSWHDAGDRYLCVILQRGHLSLHEVLRDTTLDNTLAHFVALLSDKNAQEHNPTAYFRFAHFLGQKLLPSALLSNAKSLIIIPDGLLGRLPFEALLTQPHTGGYGNAPYLLRSHTVQYAWSGTLLTQPPLAASVGRGMLQLAPFATSARDGLPLLPNSLRDKPDDISANVLQGAEATTSVFLEKAPLFAALHLSTHASAGGRAVPGIEFADRTLAVPEIYAQRLHASLVSLSACETAAGPFAQSEGVLSLARAFAYAGAQSLVASHWPVNERSTADLFSAFYENLKRGLPKAESLRQAKLAYLASAEMDARKVPFHWAAFTLTGMDGKVQMERGGQWWKWGLALALLVFALLGFRGRLG